VHAQIRAHMRTRKIYKFYNLLYKSHNDFGWAFHCSAIKSLGARNKKRCFNSRAPSIDFMILFNVLRTLYTPQLHVVKSKFPTRCHLSILLLLVHSIKILYTDHCIQFLLSSIFMFFQSLY
jgi:hypothetical protein